jgi:hypothetical protein
MNNTKIAVAKSFLSDLKEGVIEAICSEDGLDGGDGEYLLSRLNSLLDPPEAEANKELATKDKLKKAHEKFMALLQKIEEMDGLTGSDRFVLRMVAACGELAEKEWIINNIAFDLDEASNYIDVISQTMLVHKELATTA